MKISALRKLLETIDKNAQNAGILDPDVYFWTAGNDDVFKLADRYEKSFVFERIISGDNTAVGLQIVLDVDRKC
jgi:hypothetical protein